MYGNSPEDWFVIKGVVSNFRWSAGHENLLQEIKGRLTQREAMIDGVAATLDNFGIESHDLSVASYDGEYTEDFAFELADNILYGNFRGAHKLGNGDFLTAVVSNQSEKVLAAHALVRESDGLMWLPSLVWSGDVAARNETVRSSCYAAIFSGVASVLMFIAVNIFADESLPAWTVFGFVLIFILGTFPFVFAVTFLPGRPNKLAGEMGSKIFCLLDFPDPDELSFDDARLIFQNDEQHVEDVYAYALALDAMAKKVPMPTKFNTRND